MNHDGASTSTQNVGFRLSGKADSTVDALIGYGAASSTEVAGDLTVTGGDVSIGSDTVEQGKLTIEWKDSNEFGYIKMTSSDNTDSYLFVANDGTLRIHSAAPTANGDGAAV